MASDRENGWKTRVMDRVKPRALGLPLSHIQLAAIELEKLQRDIAKSGKVQCSSRVEQMDCEISEAALDQKSIPRQIHDTNATEASVFYSGCSSMPINAGRQGSAIFLNRSSTLGPCHTQQFPNQPPEAAGPIILSETQKLVMEERRILEHQNKVISSRGKKLEELNHIQDRKNLLEREVQADTNQINHLGQYLLEIRFKMAQSTPLPSENSTDFLF